MASAAKFAGKNAPRTLHAIAVYGTLPQTTIRLDLVLLTVETLKKGGRSHLLF